MGLAEGVRYSYNNGQIAMADTKIAAANFLKALEKIPSTIEQYRKGNAQYERDIPILREIVSGIWKKEDELKQLKAEAASLERKIQLSLASPKDGVLQQSIEPEVIQNTQQQQTPPPSQNQAASQISDSDKQVVFARVAPPSQSKGVKL